MTDTLTGTALASTIHKIVTKRPDLHDQGCWYYTYDVSDASQAVDPDSIHLVEILDEVEAAEWKKEEVSCNTTFCTAGWAAILNGYTLKKDALEHEYAWKDGQKYDIAGLAQDLLEIDTYVADVLFDGDTDNDDAAEILGDLGAGGSARDIVEELRYDSDDYDDEYYED